MPFRRARTDQEADLDVINLRERLAPYVRDIDLATGRVMSPEDRQEVAPPDPDPERARQRLRASTAS